MDEQSNKEGGGKKRRRRGSLIERAGSVYDFEAVLRARVVMPDGGGAPSHVIDVPPGQPLNPPLRPAPLPIEPAAPEIAAPPPPVALPAGGGGNGAPPVDVLPRSFEARGEPAALSSPEIVYRTAKVNRADLIDQGFIMPDAAITALAEEFRIVKRTLLLNAVGPTALPNGRRILICSAQANEGKTFCAVNLALSMANERDIEVLLIDGDFAKPTVLSTLGIDGPVGLMDALADPDIDVDPHFPSKALISLS